MNTTGRRIIQKTCAIATIFTMTMADISMIGANLINATQIGSSFMSYAVDVAEVNNQNIEFNTYFADESHSLETTAAVDKKDMKIVIELGVKKDGYLANAKLQLDENSNFKFQTDTNSNYIKSIDERTITFNQINEGESVKINVGVEFTDLQEFDLDYLFKTSTINLTGTYVNSKDSNTQIKGKAELKLSWTYPENIQSSLSSEVLTNSIYNEDGTNKRIVQILISSQIENNSYPIKDTNIELNLPGEPEAVVVHKRTTASTNGDKEFNSSNYNYANGKLNIKVENGQNNKIVWQKNVKDIFVVTATYPETAELTNSKITTKSSIATYNDKILSQNTETTITENKENIASIKEIETQNNIAKGKIYAGEQKNYTTNSEVNVDYANIIQKLQITEKEVKALKTEEEKALEVDYKSIKFNKSNISSVLGETWNITIKDQTNNEKTITNSNETDENGNIIVNFEAGARILNIETSKPANNGTIKYEVTKTIVKTSYSREQIKELTKIIDSNKVTYTKYDDSTNTANSSATITLKETETKASLKVEPLILTTSAEQEMHITAVLETDSEYRDLYKNPVVKIKLPKQINKISANCSLMYGNGLELKQGNFKINQENGQEVITINLTGEQKTYEGDAVKGATLDITANVELNKLSTNSSEQVVMTYTNENATSYADNGEEKVKVNVVSENSMILTNNIDEYGISSYGKEDDKQVALASNAEAKNATVKMQIVNNEESNISNIAILGKIAAIDGNIERTSNIRTNIDTARVYYTSVENPTASISKEENNWKQEATKDSKYFLVLVSSLEEGGKINFSYDINIGKNLPYNLTTETFYNISYTNNLSNTKKQVESTKIILSTGKVAEIKADLTAKVQGKEIKAGDEVKAGEIITYTAKITNTGVTDLTGLRIEANIPENTTLIMINKNYPKYDEEEGEYIDGEEYFNKVENTRKLEQNNVSIAAGKDYICSFMAIVNENITEVKDIEVKFVFTQIDGRNEEKTFTNKISPSNLKVICMPYFRQLNSNLQSGYNYIYGLKITNLTNTDQKNVKVLLDKSDAIEFKNVEWAIDDDNGDEHKDRDEYEIQLENNNTLTFNSIAANKTIIVYINARVKATKDINNELMASRLSARVTDLSGNIYRSNELIENIVGVLATIESSSKATTQVTKKGYVQSGDTIKYTYKIKNTGVLNGEGLVITDDFSRYLEIEDFKINGQNYEYQIDSLYSDDMEYDTIELERDLNVNDEINIEIVGKVKEDLPEDKDNLQIINNLQILNEGIRIATKSETIYNIEIPKNSENNTDDEDDPYSGNTDNQDTDDNNPDENRTGYTITGTVWKDENNDGIKEDEEELLEGINVYAINVQNNKIETNNNEEIRATTASDGTYELTNLPKGKYIVAFEFNTDKYMVTSYQVEGVDESINSDAVKATRVVNNKQVTAAYTDSINLKEDKTDIDLGLVEAKVFSLKLQKTISKIIVTNKNGSKTYDFKDTDLAKVELSSKELSGSNVVVEYKFKVTNVGEIAGYAKSIVDHLPSSLTFNSGLNSNWYKKGNDVYTSSLANTLIEPGETKEITLTLTKKMTESNTGLTNNKAEIKSAYNSLGIPNTTTEKDEEDTKNAGSADVIIGVKTGAAVSYVTLTLTIIIIIGGLAYLVNKKLLLEKIEI